MIRKICNNDYRFQIEKTVYYVGVTIDHWTNKYKLKCYNRASIWSFYDRFTSGPGKAGNQYLQREQFNEWSQPTFDTVEQAIGFLYFLDRMYNPTPQPKMRFTNLKLMLP